jgi:flavin reductase (DIM6/NTAB) family NADH-FMN oxidoreductase RutF
MQRMDAYDPPNTTFITPWEESKTDEKNGFISLQPYEFKNAYKFFISAVVPRPIALVSSQDAQGNINLAPFSFFTFVSYNPPICVFSCVDKGRQGGDTLKNIKQTGEFVVHIISEWYVEGANHCSGNFAADVNEFERAGLTATPSTVVQPPRVAESALAFECKLERLTALEKDLLDTDKGTGATVVYGKIVRVHCNKAIIADDSNLEENDITVALEKLKPVSRLGGNDYGLSREAFTLTRPPAN